MHRRFEKLWLSGDGQCMAVKLRHGLDSGGDASVHFGAPVVSGIMETVWRAVDFGAQRMDQET